MAEFSEQVPGAFPGGRDRNDTSSAPRQRPKTADKKYKSRTCRICMEVVQPTVEKVYPMTGIIFKPRVRYISEDPAMDPFISPCLCKGSQKYVHAGCLQNWRESAPGRENYWQCPTCKFKYRMKRLDAAQWIKFEGIEVVLTLLVFFTAVFLLGYIGDTFLSLWFDPFGTFWDAAYEGTEGLVELDGEGENNSWAYHFLKGFISFGLLGFLQSFYLSGWRVLYYGGGGAGRRRRERVGGRGLATLNWTLIVIGAVTFLTTTWKWVGVFCKRFLENTAEQILDIQGDDSDGENDGGGGEFEG